MSARWWLSRRPPRPPIPRRKCALALMFLLACHATSPHTNAIEEPTNLHFDIKHGNMTTRLTRLASSDQINPTLTQYPQRYDLRNTLNSAPHGAFPTSTRPTQEPPRRPQRRPLRHNLLCPQHRPLLRSRYQHHSHCLPLRHSPRPAYPPPVPPADPYPRPHPPPALPPPRHCRFSAP